MQVLALHYIYNMLLVPSPMGFLTTMKIYEHTPKPLEDYFAYSDTEAETDTECGMSNLAL